MKLQINIPDELYASYEKQSGSDVPAEVADFLVARLDHFQGIRPGEWLHIDKAAWGRLEKLTAGSIPNVEELLRRVENLSSLTVGGIRVEFTAAQLAEIERKAKRNGETAQAYTARIVKMLGPMFFTGSPV